MPKPRLCPDRRAPNTSRADHICIPTAPGCGLWSDLPSRYPKGLKARQSIPNSSRNKGWLAIRGLAVPARVRCQPTTGAPNRGDLSTRLLWQRLDQDLVEVAGVVGFEPTVHCTKNSCLTTWLHPSSERVSIQSPIAAQPQNRRFFQKLCRAFRAAKMGENGHSEARHPFARNGCQSAVTPRGKHSLRLRLHPG